MIATRCPNCGEESTQEKCDRCDVEIRSYCPCGMEHYKDCNGNNRCEECDEPCPCCYDGG